MSRSGTRRVQAFAHELERYASHLEPLVIPMQEGGISGTRVREALKSYDPDLWTLVDETMAYRERVDWRFAAGR